MTSANGLFFCDNDITFFDGSMISLTNANQMFEGTKIETVSHLEGRADFSSVTLAERMFAECLSLTSVKAKFTSLKDAKEMFYNCSALTEIDCEWTDNLRITSGMFYIKNNSVDLSITIKCIIGGIIGSIIGSKILVKCKNDLLLVIFIIFLFLQIIIYNNCTY